MLSFGYESGGITWAELFRTLENAKDEFNIVDYNVSQTTLESVFLDFAKLQHHDPLQD